jgi:hypothetical protein
MEGWIGTGQIQKVQATYNPREILYMSLKLTYYGQNDGSTVPDVSLVGDPGVDQATLTAAGFLGGIIVTLVSPSNATNTLVAIVPANGDTAAHVPFGTLLNGPGEFAGAIGPSGSQKAPVVRALWQGIVDSQAYDTGATWVTGSMGQYLFLGGATAGIGKYTLDARKGTQAVKVGIVTHVPTTAEPWLGVASLL